MAYAIEKAQSEAEKAIGAKTRFSKPPQQEQGDLASAIAFEKGRELKKNPKAIAEEMCAKAKMPAYFEKISSLNGFINLYFSDAFYAEALAQALDKRYGDSEKFSGKYIVEFSQPNVGKPFHVGHIRSTILGDSVANILETQGWKTIRMNYLGDSGNQVAKLLLALELFKDLPPATNEKRLLEYYVRIHKEIEANPELAEKTRVFLEKIESGDPETIKNVLSIRKKSYEAFQRNYDLLGVKFDEVVGESEFVAQAKKAVAEALDKKIAFKDKGGEIVVKLEPELPNFILLRSNGTTLYSTRDLALANWKFERFKFDQAVVFTSSEQNTYFKQIIRTLKLLGRKYAEHYKHVGFGLITLEEGKLSTREGRVVFLEDVLNDAIAYAKDEVIKRAHDYPKKEINEIAKIVGIGAAKFAVLRITPERNIMFNLKRIVNFDGDTGAYVQYTAVRSKSIIRKSGAPKIKADKDWKFNSQERSVVRLLADYPLVLQNCASSLSTHPLCNYLLELCAAFNTFYANTPVLEGGSERDKRIAIVSAVSHTLENGLSMLGIKTPERM
ncbi:MAG: arginine--tRNA ligase [Candidatus Micrarchaeota archaeon]